MQKGKQLSFSGRGKSDRELFLMSQNDSSFARQNHGVTVVLL